MQSRGFQSGPWTSNINITENLLKMQIIKVHSRPWVRNSGWGPAVCVWWQVQWNAQINELWWESPLKTKGKTQRCHMSHEGLLGLRRRKPRSSRLDEVVHHYWGQVGSCLYEVRRETTCFARRDHACVNSAPRSETLVRGISLPIRCFHKYGGPGFEQPRPSAYHTLSTPFRGGAHVDTWLFWDKGL